MKNLISTLLVAIMLHHTATAQKLRFTESTNQWTTLSLRGGDLCSFQNFFTYGADTTVSGSIYHSMTETSSLFLAGSCMGTGGCMGGFVTPNNYLVREDTSAGIVYYLNPVDSAEHILFNYNMQVGDSITYILTTGSFVDAVDSIDSTLINGVYHKIFNMHNRVLGTQRSYTILEGVGCTNSPMFPAWFPSCFEYSESLVCFSGHGSYPAADAPINSCAKYGSYPCGNYYVPSFHNTAGCVGTLNANNEKSHTRSIIVAPNPATDHLNITSATAFDNNTTISAYDVTGRCVSKTKAESGKNELNINTAEWSAGVYMIIVQNKEGIVKREKVVVVK